MSCHCSIICMFNIKPIMLESVNNPVSCMTYISNMALNAFQAINKVTALTCAIS